MLEYNITPIHRHDKVGQKNRHDLGIGQNTRESITCAPKVTNKVTGPTGSKAYIASDPSGA
jgi:hypothetical protein